MFFAKICFINLYLTIFLPSGGRSIDSGEMKRNAGSIEAQRPLKEANNLRKPGETGEKA